MEYLSKARKTRRGFALTVAATLATSLLAGCGGSTDEGTQSAELTPIRVGLPSSNYWPAYIARERELYEEAGLDPEFISFNSGAPLIAALESGSVDSVFTGLATLFAVRQGIELTYILTPLDSSSQEGFIVPENSEVQSYEDLDKLDTIGVPTASCAHISAVTAAQAAGLEPGSLNIVNVDPNILQTALDSGDIDGTFIWGPWSIALEQAGYKIVNWDADYQGGAGLCATNMAIRPAFAAQHPDVACKLIDVHQRSLEVARQEPQLGPETLQQELGLTPKIAQQTYDTLAIPGLEEQLSEDSPWSLTNAETGLAKRLSLASEALVEAEVFDQAFTTQELDSMIDPAPLEEYLSTGCQN
ncbi:hypothetical protein CQ019_06060 [Arthrobacter sp. MYb229]|uniref:ABC transporter substrate-binding protein n=1 Tax=unclassified Arthrobacter TaxID=235627 RepID=UPI000CFCCBA7|nr:MULTISPECIES: ABC transporter substrate-binding protein [unclassified Arthrobacter]PRA06911.1 hypothetical protein CQ019_06060 [Arthrobacter sp. MYb229]PRB47859.1 hypothetical protein CQ013_15855 [Arthrobacter sp. MYb216]